MISRPDCEGDAPAGPAATGTAPLAPTGTYSTGPAALKRGAPNW